MSSRSLIVSVPLLGLLIGLLAGCDRHNAANEQAAAPVPATAVPASAPLPTAGAIDRSHRGDSPPTDSFLSPDGKPTTLAAFKGKPVLVNLWATWCGPCIKELPALDAAAATFPVAAIAQDKDHATVAAYLAKAKLARIKPYVDPPTALSIAYTASLPMSILLDSGGHEVWRTMGAMEWTSARAKTLLAEAR